MGTGAGLFRAGDDVERVWDEAEAVLVACDDIEGVMATVRDAASPVEARRALKTEHGFTGRQAAVLLTLPVLSFTRSERDRLDGARQARVELFADVTGTLPALRETAGPAPEPAAPEPAAPESVGRVEQRDHNEWNVWGSEFDGTLDRIQSVMDEHYGVAPMETPVVESDSPGIPSPSAQPETAARPESAAATTRAVRRSTLVEPMNAADVIDEQIGELCDAIAELLQVAPPASPWLDDPREATSPTGQLLGSCGVDDATGIRTLLWHLRRTGLESVDAMLPFVEPLPGARGFDIQSVQFEAAMVAGALGAEPGGSAPWTGRLWPVADRRGFGYAVHYRPGPDSGAVWAYGGGEPLHRLWDSLVDMLVELYRALTDGEPIDGAVATVIDGRVVWTNLV